MTKAQRLLTCFLFLSAICLTPLAAGAGESPSSGLFDRHGLTLMHGQSGWTNVGPEPLVDYEWSTAAYTLASDLSSWFSLETQIGAGYLEADNGADSPSVELRLMGDLHYSWLFVQLGVGVAHLFEADTLPGLADSRMHSIISGTAGLRIPLGTGPAPMLLSLGYGVEHLSAISKDGSEGDTGWNAGGPRVGLIWQF